MKFDKAKINEAVKSVGTELAPLQEADVKRWAVRANVQSSRKLKEDESTPRYNKHLGFTLAERLRFRMEETMPLEGVVYSIIETSFGGKETVVVDYTDLAIPIYLFVRCNDEDSFDYEAVSEDQDVVALPTGASFSQLMSVVKEIYESGLVVRERMAVSEGKTFEKPNVQTDEEKLAAFFKKKYDALRAASNYIKYRR